MTAAVEFTPGDLLEIAFPHGLAYVHVTHGHASYPPVVRGLAGLHAQRPADPLHLLSGSDGWVAMVSLSPALERRGLTACVVARSDTAGSPFPIFRTPIRGKTGETLYWWFWNGDTLSYTTELTETQKTWPLREVTSGEAFLDRLAAG